MGDLSLLDPLGENIPLVGVRFRALSTPMHSPLHCAKSWQLLRETAGLSQAQTDWCPAPGHWSIGEVLDHITVAEAVWGRMISNVLKAAEARGALPPYPHETVAFRWRPPTADERWQVAAPEVAVPVPGKPISTLREASQDQAGWTVR